MDALAQSEPAPLAQDLLPGISTVYHEGYYEVAPDSLSYISVLKAWQVDDNRNQA
jgi:hypothetical protein